MQIRCYVYPSSLTDEEIRAVISKTLGTECIQAWITRRYYSAFNDDGVHIWLASGKATKIMMGDYDFPVLCERYVQLPEKIAKAESYDLYFYDLQDHCCVSTEQIDYNDAFLPFVLKRGYQFADCKIDVASFYNLRKITWYTIKANIQTDGSNSILMTEPTILKERWFLETTDHADSVVGWINRYKELPCRN